MWGGREEADVLLAVHGHTGCGRQADSVPLRRFLPPTSPRPWPPPPTPPTPPAPAGIYQHSFEAAQNARHGFPVYTVNIEANHLQKKGDQYSAARLTDDDKAEIRALGRDPRIGAWAWAWGRGQGVWFGVVIEGS